MIQTIPTQTVKDHCLKCHELIHHTYEFSKNGTIYGWVDNPEILSRSNGIVFKKVARCRCNK
jgi:hypothetical protein